MVTSLRPAGEARTPRKHIDVRIRIAFKPNKRCKAIRNGEGSHPPVAEDHARGDCRVAFSNPDQWIKRGRVRRIRRRGIHSSRTTPDCMSKVTTTASIRWRAVSNPSQIGSDDPDDPTCTNEKPHSLPTGCGTLDLEEIFGRRDRQVALYRTPDSRHSQKKKSQVRRPVRRTRDYSLAPTHRFSSSLESHFNQVGL